MAEYSPELAEQVCVYLAGGKSLRAIQELDGMPNKDTVVRWTLRHEEFKALYDTARKIQAELLYDEMIEIADGSKGDIIKGEDGVLRVNLENIARDRLRIETRKFVIVKILPRFADKITQEHTGPGGAPLVTPVINLTMESCAPTDPSSDQPEAPLAAGPGAHDKGD